MQAITPIFVISIYIVLVAYSKDLIMILENSHVRLNR